MTIFIGPRAAAGIQPFKAHGDGIVQAAYGSYEVTINPVAADTYELCKVPAGAVLLSGMFYCDDLDTGTEVMDFDLGWKANGGSLTHDSIDADGLANLGVLLGDVAAPNLATAVGLIYGLYGPIFGEGDFPKFSRETVIQATAQVAANSFTAGAISTVVYYVVDDSIVA